eukprot:TRINITY_DN7872_c4_g1_i1.p2 TRINITY_DN7872_c4_g1~~TRINITY_DN7872_c4_g1_i1.p2  ORF type:complete len:531 (-),score=140.71 TRINITY_DN7872_c4_g1_i1:1352-2854(-)
MALYLLFESASGYALFERKESEEIGKALEAHQEAMLDFAKFSRMVSLVSFVPFKSAEDALENTNNISEGIVHDTLKKFLELNLPKVKKGKKPKAQLGVIDSKIGSSIEEELNFPCTSSESVFELIRGIRLHFHKFIKDLKEDDLGKAQLGLAHSYSRAKVKFNINKVDNMVINAISLLDQLDKDLNTFSMRVREWYSWHFPELVRIISDNHMYAQLVRLIKVRSSLSEASLPLLEEIVMDEGKAREIIDAAKTSMGSDMSEIDMANIEIFASRVVRLAEYRKQLHHYLVSKMSSIAPNLATLIGELVGARLISHAGSLTNLAKYPASTVQILGAEKALFRALKTRGNTPKYGLIFHSSFIGRAKAKNKGRISRYLANKCSIAARIDCFSDLTTEKFGEKMRDQVEERLKFYDTGETPRKNLDVMHGVLEELSKEHKNEAPEETGEEKGEKKKKAKTKKTKKKETEVEVVEEGKAKKRKRDVGDDENTKKTEKKKKKKKET